MEQIPLPDVEIHERQRKTDRSVVNQLKDSILTKGLMHPIVVVRSEDGVRLVAGMHRLTAITELHKEERPFVFDGHPVPTGCVPAIDIIDLTEADLLEAELEENIIRAEISWQDKARALAQIHALRREANPSQTYSDTAREMVAKGAPTNPVHLQTSIKNAELLAKNLHRPSVSKARNATEALNNLLREEESAVLAEIARRRQNEAGSLPSLCSVQQGDLAEVLPELDDGLFDLIIADPPYGIGADTAGFRKRTIVHHNYEDTDDYARSIMQSILTEGFRVCKPRANLFMFGDIDLFPFFKKACEAMAWKPFRTPIVWQKSESEGLAPWGREGPRRTYELIFFATKGEKGLLQSPVDILSVKRVSRSERKYGPEKPVSLIRTLIECSTMPGDYILDPCCGAGSTLAAARQLQRRALGIELDEAAYNMATVAADHDEEPKEAAMEDLL